VIEISQLLLTFLLNACWQIALITIAAIICGKLLSGAPARYRHILWVATLLMAVLLPVLTSCAPLLRDNFIYEQSSPQQTTRKQEIVRPTHAPSDNSLPAVEPRREVIPSTLAVGKNLAIALVIIYLLFVLYRGLKLFRAWLWTRAIARSSYQAEFNDNIAATLKKCMDTIGAEKVSLLFSESVYAPITIGYRKPLIILPVHLLKEADEAVLTSSIGHELVHIRRRDYIFNLIYELIFLPISFHPAATVVKRHINHTRELCCDEIVVGQLLEAKLYVRSLLKLAGSAMQLSHPAPITTVGITDAENLEVRIMSLLRKSELSRQRKSLLVTTAILLISVSCVAAVVFAFDIGINGVSAQKKETPDSLTNEAQERRSTPYDKALFEAAKDGDISVIEELVKKGANVNCAIDGDGSPLIAAARNGNLEMVGLLLNLGADPNMAVSGDGNPLIMAAREGHSEVVTLLLDQGANIDQMVPEDENALIQASSEGHLQVVKLLVGRGANINARVWVERSIEAQKGEWRSPLSMARKGKHNAVVTYLISKGARE
jgi:bla regulator protein blaR1